MRSMSVITTCRGMIANGRRCHARIEVDLSNPRPLCPSCWKKEAVDMGDKIADLLKVWRPRIDAGDVSIAIAHALKRYSLDIEGPRVGGLISCLAKLEYEIQELKDFASRRL